MINEVTLGGCDLANLWQYGALTTYVRNHLVPHPRNEDLRAYFKEIAITEHILFEKVVFILSILNVHFSTPRREEV